MKSLPSCLETELHLFIVFIFFGQIDCRSIYVYMYVLVTL